MKQPIYSAEQYRAQVLAEINASAIPKCKSGNTPVILIRNSRTAVKRAKLEFKQELKNKTYQTELDGVKHQIVNASNVKMNVRLVLN